MNVGECRGCYDNDFAAASVVLSILPTDCGSGASNGGLGTREKLFDRTGHFNDRYGTHNMNLMTSPTSHRHLMHACISILHSNPNNLHKHHVYPDY